MAILFMDIFPATDPPFAGIIRVSAIEGQLSVYSYLLPNIFIECENHIRTLSFVKISGSRSNL